MVRHARADVGEGRPHAESARASWTATGSVYNLGGGPENAVSLRQVLARMEELLGRRVEVGFADWRPGDQRYDVSDTAHA